MTLLPEFHEQLHGAAVRRARRRLSPGFGGRLVQLGRMAPVVVSAAVAVAIAVIAVVLLGHGRAPSESAASQAGRARQALIQTLGILRTPQTAADRRDLRASALPGFLRVSSSGLCHGRTTPLPCAETLDRPLVRSVRLPGLGYRVGFFPVAIRPAAAVATSAAGEGLTITLHGPHIYLLGSGEPPVSAATLRSRGLVVSANVGDGINRGMVVVPDGVARVVLRGFVIRQPAHATAGGVRSTSARVRDNVALFGLDHLNMAALHLDPARLSRFFSQGAGSDCTLRYAIYAIPASAQMAWLNAAGATIRTQTIQLPLYVSTNHPPPGTLRAPAPGSGCHAAR
jgi:hypothetical protein